MKLIFDTILDTTGVLLQAAIRQGRLLAMAALGLVLAMQTGCVASNALNDQATLAINSFVAAPAIITAGQSSVLSWNVAGATTLSISDGSGSTESSFLTPITALSGSVTPAATTTYTMTATDTKGHSVTASVTVTVVPPPVITSFTAAPTPITNGQSSVLSWTVTGASTLSIDNNVGVVTGNSVSVSPTVTTEYTLTATNAAGTQVSAQTQVTVVLAPVIVSFTATPSTIGTGQSSTLSWSVVGATGLSINNGVGGVTGTSVSVSPTATTTYTLTAVNAVGTFQATATAQATVTVSSVPPPSITSFTSSRPSVGPNGVVTLTPVFTPTDGTATATIDQGIGTVTSGVPVDSNPLTASTTFTLTVTNATGTATAQVRVLAGDVQVFVGEPTDGGYQDGTGTAARFYQPSGMATDSSGNIYVADAGNDVIRMATPAGVVTTFAGTGQTPGSTDGTVATALFNDPTGVAVDSLGNVFVADSGNNVIREISGGNVTTLAGTPGVVGYLDGTGPAAQFGSLGALTVDSNDTLYVIDAANCNVRSITQQGVVTTIAGAYASEVCGSNDGQGTVARFQQPLGIAVDSSDNLYIADTGNSTIRMVAPTTYVVTTLAGTAGVRGSTDGTGAAASFHNPSGVAVDSDANVYVADSQNYTIRKVTPGGVVTTLVGTAGVPNPSVPLASLPGQIATPTQVTVDSTTGDMYFTMTVQAVATAPY